MLQPPVIFQFVLRLNFKSLHPYIKWILGIYKALFGVITVSCVSMETRRVLVLCWCAIRGLEYVLGKNE